MITITLGSEEVIRIQTPNGAFYMSVEPVGDESDTCISMYDHFEIRVIGNHKQTPSIVVDSEEWPTNLLVKETESAWNSLVINTKEKKAL